MPTTLYQLCSDDELLKPARDYLRQWGAAPSYRLWRKMKLKPSTKVLIARFGSWGMVQHKARELPITEALSSEHNAPYTLANQQHPDYVPKRPYVLPVSFLRTER